MNKDEKKVTFNHEAESMMDIFGFDEEEVDRAIEVCNQAYLEGGKISDYTERVYKSGVHPVLAIAITAKLMQVVAKVASNPFARMIETLDANKE